MRRFGGWAPMEGSQGRGGQGAELRTPRGGAPRGGLPMAQDGHPGEDMQDRASRGRDIWEPVHRVGRGGPPGEGT